MLNRRLIILFVALVLGMGALVARLAQLQLSQAQTWREIVHDWGNHTEAIETYRGAILDRHGLPLARDVPADELAIDYRAMNLDESWLNATARARLVESGEWDRLPDRAARLQRREEVKTELVARIDAIPAAIAEVCQIPREEVLERFQEIRSRIHILRQDQWSRRFDRKAAQNLAAATQASAIGRWWDGLWSGSTADSTGSTDEGRNGLDDDASLDRNLRSTPLREELIAHTIRSNIPAAVANYFRQHSDDFPGLIVRDKANRREYPFGESAAHITGTLRSLTPQSLAASTFRFPDLSHPQAPATAGPALAIDGNLQGYLPGDRQGESAGEKLLEPLLRGYRGARLMQLADAIDPASGAADIPHLDPQPGKDVRLTLDAALQRDLYTALLDPSRSLLIGSDGKPHFVGIVVLGMDGQVLALVSYPSYDPNQIDTLRDTLNRDTRRPLTSRAFREKYSPGSTVKPLVAAAALTESVITAQTTFDCIGHFYASRPDIFRCDAIHGDIQLVDAIGKSCNVYFFNVGQRMGLERISRWYGLYGFGHESGMELPEEAGTLPNPTAPDSDTARNNAMLLGIGQGPLDVTPLQMANAYATFLRGGLAIAPRILADAPARQSRAMQFSPSVLATVRQGMEECVSTGTAKSSFQNFHLRLAGKTGTAEKERPVFDDAGNPVDDLDKPLSNPDGSAALKPDGSRRYKQLVERHDDAWFVGYAPADKPKFVVAAIMEWGGHGGVKAAPLVREAFLQLQRHDYLEHTDVP